MAWLTGWSYRKKLTVDHSKVDSDCSDFPVKVIFDEDNFAFAHALETGNDVRFTASDGETLLKYEREIHDEVNPNAIRVIDGYSLGAGNITREADHWAFSVTTGTQFATRILVSAGKIDLTNISKIKVNWEKVDPTYEYSRPYLQISNNQMGDRTDYVAQFDAHGTYGSGLWGPATNELDVSAYSGSYYIKLIGALTTNASYGHTQKVYDIWLEDADENKIKQGMEYVTVSAVYHIKIPTVSSTSDTDIYMYYGKADATDGADPENVWDSNYKMVLHMDSALLDSTANDNDGTNSGTTLGLVRGGYCRRFSGSSQYITYPTLGIFDGTGQFTFELHYNQSVGGTQQIISAYGENQLQIQTGENQDANILHARANVGSTWWDYVIASAHDYEAWYVASISYHPTSGWVLARGGASLDTDASTGAIGTRDRYNVIGARRDTSAFDRFYNGLLSEVRISSTARSLAWHKATYHSLADTLLTYGAEEALTPTARPRVMVVWA